MWRGFLLVCRVQHDSGYRRYWVTGSSPVDKSRFVTSGLPLIFNDLDLVINDKNRLLLASKKQMLRQYKHPLG